MVFTVLNRKNTCQVWDAYFVFNSSHASSSLALMVLSFYYFILLGRIMGYFRVSVQGVRLLGGHFACLCRGFEFYEVKKNCYYFSKRKWKYFYTFNHFYREKSSKRAK